METPLKSIATRLEVLEGPTGRRSWSDEKKASIISESFAPGVRVKAVALRHGLAPQHLSTWRRLAKDGKIVLPAGLTEDESRATFTPIVIEDEDVLVSSLSDPDVSAARPSAVDFDRDILEIEMEGIVLRVPGLIDPVRLATLVSALRTAPDPVS